MPKNRNFQISFPEEAFSSPSGGKPNLAIGPDDIRRTETTNRKIFLRDNRTAARVFGLYNKTLERLPRPKFLFFVNFVIPDRKNFGQPYTGWNTGVSLAVKSVSRPSMSFDLTTLNQYNRKRIVQSGVNYDDVTIELYDTRDQRVFKMFKDYYDFYYGDATAGHLDWMYDITMVDFHYPANAKDFGFNPPDALPDQAYFFERIEVYEFNHKRYNKYSLLKPKIRSFSYDVNDYTDGGSPQIIRLTISYEGVVWEKINEEINADLLEESGRNLGDFHDVAVQYIQFDAKRRKDAYDNIGVPAHQSKIIRKIKGPENGFNFLIRTPHDTAQKQIVPNQSKTSFSNGGFAFAVKQVLSRAAFRVAREFDNRLKALENVRITDLQYTAKVIQESIRIDGLEKVVLEDLKRNIVKETNDSFSTSLRQITGNSVRGLLNRISSVNSGKTEKVHIRWFLTESETVSPGKKTSSTPMENTDGRRLKLFYP